MNRHALPLLLCALLGGATFPLAQAGGAINKCVDGAGRITLTDQACDAHTVSSSVAVPGVPDVSDNAAPAGQPASMERVLPVRPANWLPVAAPHAALAGDVATLKQARIRMMLQDAAPRTRLASLSP